MPSIEVDAIYERLLKRYREHGFLRPEAALGSSIQSLVMKGRTRDEAILELNLSESPWTYLPAIPSTASVEAKESGPDKAVLEQIANLREKIDSLTAFFSKGEITQETYLRSVKKIEADIDKLQREHNIPKVKEKNEFESTFGTGRQREAEELGETPSWVDRGAPSGLWYLVPFFFGILGGILGYIAVKSDDPDMADTLLIFGFLWTFVLGFLSWILIFRLAWQ